MNLDERGISCRSLDRTRGNRNRLQSYATSILICYPVTQCLDATYGLLSVISMTAEKLCWFTVGYSFR